MRKHFKQPAERSLSFIHATLENFSGLGGEAALEGEEDEISAAANTKFGEEVGDVEFDGALGDIEFAGDFLVGEILQERIEHFLFAAAKIGDAVGFDAATLSGKDGIDKAGKKLARNPEPAFGYEGKGAHELIPGFDVSEQAFYTEAEKRIAVGFVVLVANDNEARVGITFEKIGEQRAGGLARGVRVNDVNLGFGQLNVAHVGSEGGLQKFGDNLKLRCFNEQAFELTQHQGVRREKAYGQLGSFALGSH
jgi:hypothetical protein